MADDRLPTGLWVEGHIHQLTLRGIPYYIHNKGPYASGTVLLKINGLENGCMLLQQQRDFDGNMGWMDLRDGDKVAESEVDSYIRKAIDMDPDLWVIEYEDRTLENIFDGEIF